LHLSKLEIFGFKSFPEKTKIEFAEGVSAIVGPNGSGKSNIVDALRWVLGEQGDKILRSEKRDDVVFNGTRVRKPLSVAEVSLTIDNSKGTLPVSYTEISIARRFYRSGDTEYFLNGVRVRLKDIRQIFINTGIGPDAYSVIELKMVETILSHVKNERRKLFEEVSVIVSYTQNSDLTYKKLDIVKETLTRLNDIIKEKQRNISALDKQYKRNEEARTISDELKIIEIAAGIYDYKYMLKEIQDIKDHEAENISLKNSLQTEIIENDALLDKYIEDITRSENNLNSVSIKVNEKNSEIDKLERFNLVISQEIKFLEANIERLNNENIELSSNIKNNRDRIEDIDGNISLLKNTLGVSEESLLEKRKRLDAIIESISLKKNELTHLGEKLKIITKNLNDKKREYGQNKVKYESNLDRLDTLSAENEKNILLISELENENINIISGLKTIDEKIKSLQKIHSGQKSKIDKLNSEIKHLDDEKNRLTIILEQKKSKISYLENLLESFEDYIEGINYILKDRKHKNAFTFIDTLEVKDKYKFAIETALGEVSNYLVLNDSRNLFKLIDELRDSEKGKVTFILNDKLFSNLPFYFEPDDNIAKLRKEEGVFGPATDFVKCKHTEFEELIRLFPVI